MSLRIDGVLGRYHLKIIAFEFANFRLVPIQMAIFERSLQFEMCRNTKDHTARATFGRRSEGQSFRKEGEKAERWGAYLLGDIDRILPSLKRNILAPETN